MNDRILLKSELQKAFILIQRFRWMVTCFQHDNMRHYSDTFANYISQYM